ncbi:hypothetical protein GMORB2_2708 [Geosmithia morbida]|uniref:Uncharacterized protein n=1 Tax=Geosmithia morbida TaxID=1094350 RepID=A0A9P4YTG3_9HYPO|nr:uncharacterized protein GMORB2_2708 [Geosmithia morbida]KAF4120704.1 hypothetical protein GMORB2_2708 [Geosmithia morbida]
MPVVECAVIKLRQGFNELDLYEQLMEGLDAQDDWVRCHQPHLLRGKRYQHKVRHDQENLSSLYMTHTDPAYLLVTAPWDSPETHGEWLKSDENKTTFSGFYECHLSPDADAVSVCHVVPSGTATTPRSSSCSSRPPTFKKAFHVEKRLVDRADKDAAQRVLEELIAAAKEAGDQVWAGWTVKDSSGAEHDEEIEELIIFSEREYDFGIGRTKQSFLFNPITVPNPVIVGGGEEDDDEGSS